MMAGLSRIQTNQENVDAPFRHRRTARRRSAGGRARCPREDLALGQPGRLPHHGPARAEREPQQHRVGVDLRAAAQLQREVRTGPVACDELVARRQPAVEVQPAQGSEVPRRHAVHRRRRGLHHRTRDGADVELPRLHDGHPGRAQDRRPHRPDLHDRAEPGAAAAADRDPAPPAASLRRCGREWLDPPARPRKSEIAAIPDSCHATSSAAARIWRRKTEQM